MARSRTQNSLSKLCEESPLPIYALDDQRRIVACNRACTEWLGIAAEQLIGQRCDYVAGENSSMETAAGAALCPPPQAFLGELATGWITWTNAAKALERRSATFLPVCFEEPASLPAVF